MEISRSKWIWKSGVFWIKSFLSDKLCKWLYIKIWICKFSFFTAVGQATLSPQKNCRAGYVSHGTSCYKFVKTPVQSWQLAENLCQGDGGVLASINSNYENSFIESQMGPNFDYWIGLQFDQVLLIFQFYLFYFVIAFIH